MRDDRELLAELARLNRRMAALCLRIMDGSASGTEQMDYAQRLIAAGERLRQRGEEGSKIVETAGTVIDGEVLESGLSLALPGRSAKPGQDGSA